MDLTQAFKKAIKSYFEEGFTPEELNSLSKKKLKYNKDYFDKVGEDMGLKVKHKEDK